MLRYLVSLLIVRYGGGLFPLSTLAVNVAGCFVAGMLFNVAGNPCQPALRLLLMVGFCGGFTTFSAFAVENVNLWQAAAYFKIVLYATLSVLLGFAAAWIGMEAVK